MKPMNWTQNASTWFLLTTLTLITLGVTSCGQKEEEKAEEPRPAVRIKVLSLDEKVQADEFDRHIEAFAQAHSEWVVHSTTERFSPQERDNLAPDLLDDADALVFPTFLNPPFRQNTQAFHPLSATMAVVPEVFDQAYAMAEDDQSLWAVPFLFDPVVMVMKKQATRLVGDASPPETWGKLNLISAQALNNGFPMPHLVFLTGDPLLLADSLTTLQFAVGMGEISASEEDLEIILDNEERALQDSLSYLRNYMTPDEEDLTSLPQLQDMQGFMDSKAILTLARYSSVLRLGEAVRNQLHLTLFTGDFEKILVPTYGYAAAVPLNASSPQAGQAFVRYLLEQANGDAHLSLDQIQSPDQKWLTHVTHFLPRENPTSVNQKWVIDALNGSLRLSDYTNIWKKAYFFPESFN